jgi:ribonuclease HI
VVVVLETQLLLNEIMSESNLHVKAVYTDGACSGNPGPGGWGVLVQFTNGQQQELGGGAAQTTNNRMELQAAIEAVKFLESIAVPSAEACVYTDSEYVKNGITKWLLNWKKRGWKTAQGKPVLNQDLWETLDALKPNQHDWQYIKAHAGHPGNERADAIARAFSLKQNPHLTNLEDVMVSAQSSSIAKASSEPLQSVLTSKKRLDSIKEISDSESIETKSIKQPELAPLERLMISLQHADTISSSGFLISTPELAALMESDLNTILHRGDRWTWRNWTVSRVREEDGQILWQLERIHKASV